MANQVDLLLLAHDERGIYDEEFLPFCDLQKSNNLHIPLKYDRFSLQNTREHKWISESRFHIEDSPVLWNILQIPERVICYNGTNISSLEAFCSFLKRYFYPCRYLHLIPGFGRNVPKPFMITQLIINFIYSR